jgi:hypothetical protein
MPDLYPNEPDTLPAGVFASPACPPLALLRARQEDALPADLARDVASHVEDCSLCSTLISDLGHLPQPGITAAERARIRQKLPLIAPTARTGGWRWYTAAGAAAALVIAGVLVTINQTQHPRQAHMDVPITTEPAQTQADAPQAVTPSAGPQLAKLEPPVDLSPALVLRGEPTTSEPTAQQLAPAFDAYSRNDYTLATQRFSQLAKQFPRSGTPFLYLGVTQLLANENASALYNLTRAEQFVSPDQKDAASWYRAIAALRTGAPNASQLLHAICGRNGSTYAQQACQLEQMHSSN